jgi:acyl-CoA thioester hydrolase
MDWSQIMSRPFVTRKRVEFGDTDMAGIVHFSNFFRYMEVAETDFLHSKGMSVSWYVDGVKHGFPRVSASCDYKRPAKFEDVLDIEVSIEEIGRKSVKYRFDFKKDNVEIAIGRIAAVYCRSTSDRPIESLEMTEEMRAKLTS